MTQTPHPADTAPSGQPAPTPPPQQSWQSQGARFWDDILSTGLRRDRSRQWFAGVCSGIARRVDVDPVLIRAAFIALTLFGGFGIVAYLVAWLLLPDDSGRIMARDALSGNGGEAGGAIVLSVIAVLVIAAIVFGDNGFLIGWGVIPLAIVAWLFWRHQQGRDNETAWSGATPPGSFPSATTSTYAASFPSAPAAPTEPVGAGAHPTPGSHAVHGGPVHGGSVHGGSVHGGSGHGGWQPPPAPPVPPRPSVPLAPPPPPRPRRRSAGLAGFALTLGTAVVGYGAGLLLEDPLGFTGSPELFGVVLALGAASLTTLVIGLSGRRSMLSAGLVVLLGLGATVAAVSEQAWDGERGVRTWAPTASTSPSRFEHGAGRTTLDLRPLFASLGTRASAPAPSLTPTPVPTPAPGASATPAPAPTPSPSATTPPTAPATPPTATTPQEIDVDQGAGEMTILVPQGASAQIRARAAFGEVRVLGNLPGALSDRDTGAEDGPSETVTVDVGTGAPVVIVRADIRFGQITIQEG